MGNEVSDRITVLMAGDRRGQRSHAVIPRSSHCLNNSMRGEEHEQRVLRVI